VILRGAMLLPSSRAATMGYIVFGNLLSPLLYLLTAQ